MSCRVDYFVYEKKMPVEYSESHIGQLCKMRRHLDTLQHAVDSKSEETLGILKLNIKCTD